MVILTLTTLASCLILVTKSLVWDIGGPCHVFGCLYHSTWVIGPQGQRHQDKWPNLSLTPTLTLADFQRLRDAALLQLDDTMHSKYNLKNTEDLTQPAEVDIKTLKKEKKKGDKLILFFKISLSLVFNTNLFSTMKMLPLFPLTCRWHLENNNT